MTLPRLLQAALVLSMSVSASAQDAPAEVVVQAPLRMRLVDAKFSSDDEYVLLTDGYGGSLVEVTTGRVMATRTEPGFAELVARVSQGSLDARFVEPEDYEIGEPPEPVVWNGPDGAVAEYRPAWEYYEEGEEEHSTSRLTIGGQEVELELHELHYVTPERFGLRESVSAPLEIRDVANPGEIVQLIPGSGSSTHGEFMATVDGASVVLTSFRTLQSETIPHGLATGRAIVADLDETSIVVNASTESVVFSRRPGHEVIWRGPGRVLGRTARSLLIERTPAEGGLPQMIRRNLSTGRERVVLSLPGESFGGHHGAFLISDDDSILIMDRRGRRSRLPIGNRHSVWHAQTYEGLLVMSGRFGVQRWTREGVLDSPECEGTQLLGLMSTGSLASRAGRCTRRGVSRPWGERLSADSLHEGGDHVLLSNGVIRHAGGGGVQLEGVDEQQCDGDGDDLWCSWHGRAVGMLVGVDVEPEMFDNGEGAPPPPPDRVFDAQTGRPIAEYPAAGSLVLAPDGQRYAVVSGQRGEVFNVAGERLFRFRMRHRNSEATPRVSFLADGVLRWSYDAQTPHYLDERGRRTTPSAGVSGINARCHEGHWRLGPAGDEGPACDQEGELAEAHGERVIDRDRSGLVRMYTHGRVLTLGTIRRGASPLHYIYDDQGRWWSSNPRRTPLMRRVGDRMEPMVGQSDPTLLELLVAE